MKNILLKVSLSTVCALSIITNNATAQGWQALSLNRLIAINQFDNTQGTATGNNQVNSIHVGIGTNVPDPLFKTEIFSNGSSNLALAGYAPSTQYCSNVLWNSSAYQASIGLSTGATDFVWTSTPGDFCIQNWKNGHSMIFANGASTSGSSTDGVERMRINANGFVGINTSGHTSAAVWDRFDVKLNASEFIRFENMPSGNYNPLTIDPATGRLYMASAGSGGAGDWLLLGNSGTNPAVNFLGTIDNKNLVLRTNNQPNITIVPQTGGGGLCNVGINTFIAPGALPSTEYKLQVWSAKSDAHVGIAGSAPSLRFSDNINSIGAKTNASTAEAEIGLATHYADFVHFATKGDFVMRNENPAKSLIFATNKQTVEDVPGYPGAEKMRIDQNGYIGINTINNLVATYGASAATAPATSGVLDRVDIFLGTTNYTVPGAFGYTADQDCPIGNQEYVRIQNMPRGEYNYVTMDPATGRLYMSGKGTGGGTPPSAESGQENIDLKNEVDALKNELAAVKLKLIDLANCCASNATMASVKQDATGVQAAENVLYQNAPNPFNRETSIAYLIMQMNSSASIMITDMNGKELSKYPITQTGRGSITVPVGTMVPGIYLYTLIIDGNAVDTKKMVVNAQ